MQNDLYECARRKCRHRYKHNEAVYVPRESRPTGTCPKCGHDQFYILKAKKSPNAELSDAGNQDAHNANARRSPHSLQ